MSWIRVYCKNPTCRAEFKVDEAVPSRDCHRCGVTHTQPWEQHDPRLEPPENNHPPELVCEGCFTEFDVRREPVNEYQTNLYRCPNCGRDHSDKDYDPTRDPPASEPPTTDPEVVDAEPVAADGGDELPPELIDRAAAIEDALETENSGGDIHLHFHNDG